LANNKVYINSYGNVGIGTSTPTSNIQVVGNTIISNVITTANIYSSSGIYQGGSLLLPSGVVMIWGSSTTPSGWLNCDGNLYSISDSKYTSLFSVIGYRYGGVVSSTFSVPNITANFVSGASTINNLGTTGGSTSCTLATSTMPSHTHTISLTDPSHSHTTTDPGHTHSYTVPDNDTYSGNYLAASGNYLWNDGSPNNSYSTGSSSASVSANVEVTGISMTSYNNGSGTQFSILNNCIGLFYVIKL
jgi:microcystin-dependent protein